MTDHRFASRATSDGKAAAVGSETIASLSATVSLPQAFTSSTLTRALRYDELVRHLQMVDRYRPSVAGQLAMGRLPLGAGLARTPPVGGQRQSNIKAS